MSQSTSNLLPTEKYTPVLPREPAWDAPPPQRAWWEYTFNMPLSRVNATYKQGNRVLGRALILTQLTGDNQR